MAIKEPQPSQVTEALDPLASLTAPPKNESKIERFRREQRELFAKHISDRIDQDLNGEKVKAANRKPEKKKVRVLVLGHRSSGRLFRFSYKFNSNLFHTPQANPPLLSVRAIMCLGPTTGNVPIILWLFLFSSRNSTHLRPTCRTILLDLGRTTQSPAEYLRHPGYH